MKKFLKVFAYCTGFAALCLIMQIVAFIPVTVFFIFMYSVLSAVSGKPESYIQVVIDQAIHDSIMPSYILSAIMTFFSAWLIHIIFKRKFFERLSFNKTSFVSIAVSFIAGCSLQMPISFMLSLAENTGIAPDLFEQYSNHLETLMDNQNLVLQILAVGIAAPLLEEIIFRGLIFNQLKKNISIPAAIITQALIFGIVHLNVIQGLYAFVIGIILGLALLWSDSLLLPIAIHMGMNLSGVFLSEYGSAISDTAGMIIMIVSFLLIPVCMLFLHHHNNQPGYRHC